MNALRPLLFLTYKTIFNGLKRAFTSPRRLIGMIVIMGYYFLMFIRPAMMPARSFPGQVSGRFQFPPLEVIDALAFTVFAFLSVLMLLSISSGNTNYRPADVDILFPTPISPKVLLIFRMLRDYVIILLTPLVIMIIGLKPVKMGWEAIFKNIPNPQYAELLPRFMWLSWMLMALGWITINYAVSLYVNRTDRDSARNRKILSWSIAVVVIAVFAFVYLRIQAVNSPEDLLALAKNPLLRAFFFMATFATEFTLSPFSSSMFETGAIGLTGLLLVPIVGIMLSLRQVDWMYDQAAVRAAAFQTSMNLRRSGDVSGMAAQAAREGRRHLKLGFVQRIKMNGPWALIWKELILQPRTMLGFAILFTILGVMMNILPILFPDKSDDVPLGYTLIGLQAVTVLMVAMTLSQTGFVEVLRRVDLQKPLPFRPATTVWFEIASKGLMSAFPGVVGALVVLVLRPQLWGYVVGALLLAPAIGLLICSSTFLVTMLFPDIEDPSQRQFRGIMSLLGVVIAGVFPLGALVGLAALHVPPYLAAAVSASLAIGIAFLITVFSGQLYAGFNPSE